MPCGLLSRIDSTLTVARFCNVNGLNLHWKDHVDRVLLHFNDAEAISQFIAFAPVKEVEKATQGAVVECIVKRKGTLAERMPFYNLFVRLPYTLQYGTVRAMFAGEDREAKEKHRDFFVNAVARVPRLLNALYTDAFGVGADKPALRQSLERFLIMPRLFDALKLDATNFGNYFARVAKDEELPGLVALAASSPEHQASLEKQQGEWERAAAVKHAAVPAPPAPPKDNSTH
jgi:hypothetical protein